MSVFDCSKHLNLDEYFIKHVPVQAIINMFLSYGSQLYLKALLVVTLGSIWAFYSLGALFGFLSFGVSLVSQHAAAF